MAPSRPLVLQQINACHTIVGIPRAISADITGLVAKGKRDELWSNRRVLFATPQVVHQALIHQRLDPTEIVCVVVDEAHRATGNHSFCSVLSEMSSGGGAFRVLALSATPGSQMSRVQAVVNNLLISRIEAREETDLDVAPYVHRKTRDVIAVTPTESMKCLRAAWIDVVRKPVRRLAAHGAIFTSEASIDKLALGAIVDAQRKFFASPPPRLSNSEVLLLQSDFGLVVAVCHVLAHIERRGFRTALAAAIELANSASEKRAGARFEAIQSGILQNAVDVLKGVASKEKHPKLAALGTILRDHFADGDERSRVIVFAEARECVSEVVDYLRLNVDIVRPVEFVGQAVLKQREQGEVLARFKRGDFNALISTCIGEEGLDIGHVDLIVHFDVVQSPVRSIQRSGRTGRDKEGRVVILATAGAEEAAVGSGDKKAKSMAASLKGGGLASLHYFDGAPRLIPIGTKPRVVFMNLDVEDSSLIEAPPVREAKVRDVFRDAERDQYLKKFESVMPCSLSLQAQLDFQILPASTYCVAHGRQSRALVRLMQSIRGVRRPPSSVAKQSVLVSFLRQQSDERNFGPPPLAVEPSAADQSQVDVVDEQLASCPRPLLSAPVRDNECDQPLSQEPESVFAEGLPSLPEAIVRLLDGSSKGSLNGSNQPAEQQVPESQHSELSSFDAYLAEVPSFVFDVALSQKQDPQASQEKASTRALQSDDPFSFSVEDAIIEQPSVAPQAACDRPLNALFSPITPTQMRGHLLPGEEIAPRRLLVDEPPVQISQTPVRRRRAARNVSTVDDAARRDEDDEFESDGGAARKRGSKRRPRQDNVASGPTRRRKSAFVDVEAEWSNIRFEPDSFTGSRIWTAENRLTSPKIRWMNLRKTASLSLQQVMSHHLRRPTGLLFLTCKASCI